MSSARAMDDPGWTFCGLLLLVAASCLPSPANAGLTVQTVFNQRGIQGTITFTQDQPDANTTISVNLTGLEQFNESYPWHVHQYPFPLGIENPCRTEITGGHYDPLGANLVSTYVADCARDPELCEIGDLSGKFGGLNASESVMIFTDSSLSLYGIHSIIGRSVVIHRESGARLVCANIEYPVSESVEIVHTPFRRVFAGNMYFRQHTNDATSSVYVDLIRVNGTQQSTNHNWHVHESAVNTSDLTCSSAGPHYNPRDAPADQPIYSQICNSTAQENCEVGDLSNKGAPLDVSGGVSKFFYTDIDLPLLGEEISIVDRSVVIHAEGRGAPRISCANNSRFSPLQAVAFFDEDGVSGSIRFLQDSPFDETQVNVTLGGLEGRAAGYHVHVTPVGPGGSGSERCMGEFTGGHWNPLGVIYDENNPQITSDQFEIGDISGKFGSLAGRDSISTIFSDPNIPLSGVNGIIGRSIVVHYPNGSRWFCSNVVHSGAVIQHTVALNMSNVSGQVTFIQPADSPFAETVIIVEAEIDIQFPEVTPSMSPIPFQSSALFQPPTPTSVPAPPVATTQPTPATPQTPVSAPSSLQFVSGSLLPSPIPTSSTGVSMSSSTTQLLQSSMQMLLLPLSATTTPSSVPQGRKRRAESTHGKAFARSRVRRQSSGTQGFGWSLRQLSSGQVVPDDCNSLPLYDPFMSSPIACSPATPLGCPSGDLTSKHGPFPARAVFTDPNLPLSGPDSVFAAGGLAVLLLLPPSDAGSVPAICAQVELIPPPAPPTTTPPAPPATTPTAPPATTPTAPPTTAPTAPPTTTRIPTVSQSPGPADDAAPIGLIVGAVVGGLVGAILLLIIVIIILCCLRNRSRDDYHVVKGGRGRDKDTTVELGHVGKRMDPVFGVPHYRVLYDYNPRNEGDLPLTKGDWVTLIEAPYGGEWWQGSVGDKEGWFPKSYIEYVDMQAEKKKLEEDNFKLAAVAIVAASSSFSAKHGSLAANRKEKVEPRTRRAYTFSKMDIDSTPKLVTRLDHTSDKEREAEGGVVIENLAIERTGSNGTGPPGTPKSQRNAEIIMNPNAAYAALYGSPNATPTLIHKTQSPPLTSPLASSQDPNATYANVDSLAGDRYVAKYDFTGSTDIELPMRKGDTVVVVGRSESGWCQGISGGHMGWFPETYIEPAPVETPRVQPLVQPRRMSEMMAGEVEELEVSEFRALHSYQSSLVGDLAFPEGATVLVYWADDSGWWYGAASGEQGWFPGSYVEPIVEGGSQLTSPVQGEEEEGGPVAAARKPDDEQKKTKRSFKKKWSMKRRGSRKDSEKEAAGHSEVETAAHIEGGTAANIDSTPSEPLASPRARLTSEEASPRARLTSEEGPGLQEEIAAALSSVFSHEGSSKKMSIDERVALMKERRASEDTAKENELSAALARRTSQTGSHEPRSPTTVAETTVAAVQKEPEPSQERLEPEGSEAVLERSETPRREGEGQGGEKEERKEPVMERRETPAGEAAASSPAQSSRKKSRTSVSALGKPKRKAPPPPAGAVQVMPQRVESPVQPKRSVTATLPAHMKASREDIPKSRTMASASARPKAQKRRTTAADQKEKPRRRPPPPPQAALAAVLRSNPINKLDAVTEDTDSVFVDDARRGTVPLLQPATAAKGQFRKASEPIRMRPRVQRVKRPLSRNIPPPPSIPLPPPPARKIPRESSVSQEPGQGEGRKTSRPKPAIKPKPAHLSEAMLKMKESETSVASRESDRTVSPNSQEDGEPGAVLRRTPRGPKPPPPARTSSLSEQHAHLQPWQKPSLASISDSKEESEEESALVRSLPPSYPPPPRPVSVLSGNLNEDGQARKKSDAPERPPPPRPENTKSSRANRESATQEDSEGKHWGASLKRKGSSLMQSLKRMVKKSESGKDLDVQADGEGAQASTSDDVEKSRPPKPSEPPPARPSSTSLSPKPSEPPPALPSSTSLSPTLSEDAAKHTESPVPKPRTKLLSQTSTEDNKQTSQSTKSEGRPKPVPLPRAAHSPSPDTPSSPPESPKTPNNFFRAVKSYKAERSMELSFSAGDILIEVDRPNDKFIYGMLDDGNTGLFPVSHVEPFYSPSS